jgi:hypothetical protein
MFLHYTMTDREILRSCEGCTSPHLKLVADRLRERVDNMAMIELLAKQIEHASLDIGIVESAQEIQSIAENDGA